MKLCITAAGEGLDAPVDSRFGRAPYFVIVDTDSERVERLPNAGASSGHGAGVKAAQAVARTAIHRELQSRLEAAAPPAPGLLQIDTLGL